MAVMEPADELLSELTFAEAKVTAYTQVIRDLETDPSGFCPNCFLHLRRRLRTLQNRYISALYKEGEGIEEALRQSDRKSAEGLSDKWRRQAAAYAVENTRQTHSHSDRRNARSSGLDYANGKEGDAEEDGPWDGPKGRRQRASAGARLPARTRLGANGGSHYNAADDEEEDTVQSEGSTPPEQQQQQLAPPSSASQRDGRRPQRTDLSNDDWPRLREGPAGQGEAPRQRPTLRPSNPLMAALKAVANSRAGEGFRAAAKLSDSGAGGRAGGGAGPEAEAAVVAGQGENFSGGSGRGRMRSRREEESERRQVREGKEGAEEDGGEEGGEEVVAEMSEAEKKRASVLSRERSRLAMVVRKKNLVCYERIHGRQVNVLEGLELHENLFSEKEQQSLVNFVYETQEKGRRGELTGRTYSEPRKWMRGKGRVTVQFGCCYNYAIDKEGNAPGILRRVDVDPLPPLLRRTIQRLVRFHVLPPDCIPDSCIINIYDEGDCIPPHIDHHDFLRPFCTLSLLSEAPIVFGSNLKIMGPGEFKGVHEMKLPTGSVLVLQGNGADVAKHSIPAVPSKRISITFRKMDPSKVPFDFTPEPDLVGIKPLALEAEKTLNPPPANHRTKGSYLRAAQIAAPADTSRPNGRMTPGGAEPAPSLADTAMAKVRLSVHAAAFVPQTQAPANQSQGTGYWEGESGMAADGGYSVEFNGEGRGPGSAGQFTESVYPLHGAESEPLEGFEAEGSGACPGEQGSGREEEHPLISGRSSERGNSEEEREIETVLEEMEREERSGAGAKLSIATPIQRNWGDEDSGEEWDPEMFEVPSPVSEEGGRGIK